MSTLFLRSAHLLRRSSLMQFKNFQINKRFLQRLRQDTDLTKLRSSAKKKAQEVPSDFVINITWKSVTVSAVIGAAFLGYMYYLKYMKDIAIEIEQKKSMGKARIGGKFELVNTKGETVTSDDLLGKWVCIYFGFTHCPDVCPDELEKLSTAVDQLESTYEIKILPIFITVDPQRDSPEIIDKYLKEFSPKLIGLTGTSEQIAKACKAYRVYFSNGPKDVDNDYIVDHTIIIYLVNPDGEFVDYFGQTSTAKDIVNNIVVIKKQFDNMKKETIFPNFFIKKEKQEVA